MLNHFSVSDMTAISNDPNNVGYSYQVSIVETSTDGSSQKVFKIKTTDGISSKIAELANLLTAYQPTASSLEEAKFLKLAKIQNEWNQQLQQGWNSGRGRLGLTAEDVALLSGAFALAKEANALGMPLPSLVTLENTLIEFQNLQEMTQLMLQYGSARSYLSIQFAAKRKAVEDAITVEEVEAI